jgi:hypothetical protein
VAKTPSEIISEIYVGQERSWDISAQDTIHKYKIARHKMQFTMTGQKNNKIEYVNIFN